MDNWTYRDFVDFTEAYQSGNLRPAYRLAENLIVSWDYDVSLDEPEALELLPVEESSEVLRTILTALGNFVETLDTSPVKVSFKKWNTKRFLDFNEARRDKNMPKIEQMVHEVAQLDGLNPADPLPFVEGTMVLKAIQEAYQRVLQGKN